MNTITINQITNANQLNVLQFNTLLDDGKSWDEEQAQRFLSNQNNALFVAFANNKEVGFASAYRLQHFDNFSAEVLLYEIGVDESFRRQGIGSLLISQVKKWSSEVGAGNVWVLTEEDNEIAQSLYMRTGGSKEPLNSSMFTYSLKE